MLLAQRPATIVQRGAVSEQSMGIINTDEIGCRTYQIKSSKKKSLEFIFYVIK